MGGQYSYSFVFLKSSWHLGEISGSTLLGFSVLSLNKSLTCNLLAYSEPHFLSLPPSPQPRVPNVKTPPTSSRTLPFLSVQEAGLTSWWLGQEGFSYSLKRAWKAEHSAHTPLYPVTPLPCDQFLSL